jgi:hypothetical protein
VCRIAALRQRTFKEWSIVDTSVLAQPDGSKAMNRRTLGTVALIATLAVAAPAAGQRGTGQTEGVARQPELPALTSLSGVVEEVQIDTCEMTTGRAAVGAHVLVGTEQDGTLNLHLGPAAAIEDLLAQLAPGVAIEAEVFRTERMPEDAYVAQAVTVDGESFTLRDDATLRPRWAIGPDRQPGAGRGAGRGAGQGAGMGPGAGMGRASGGGQGRAGGSCWWQGARSG